MKTRLLIKIVSVILLALLHVPTFTACSSSEDKVRPHVWEASEDGKIISNSDRAYYEYELPVGYTVEFSPRYDFKNRVEIDGDEEYIFSYARVGAIFALNTPTDDFCYVTDDGLKSINDLISGEREQVYLYNYNYMDDYLYPIDESILKQLDLIDTGIEIDVSELQYLKDYTVRRYDSTRMVYRTSGALYEYKGLLRYVNYDSLSNEYFDSEGNFSYRAGTFVTMYDVISNRDLYDSIIEALDNGEKISDDYIKERKDIRPEREKMDPETREKAWFWTAYSIMAFGLPAWPFTIGVLNSRSKKHGKSRLWLVQSLAALLWVFIGVVMMLLLL